MIITTPVTDYIPASILTTRGDIAVRGISIPQRLATTFAGYMLMCQGAGGLPIYGQYHLDYTGIHVGASSRGADGDEVISGLDFEPSVAIFLGVSPAGIDLNWCVGYDDGTVHKCISVEQDGTRVTIQPNQSLYIYKDVGNYIKGTITAKDSTSVTITWVRAGASSISYNYLFLP